MADDDTFVTKKTDAPAGAEAAKDRPRPTSSVTVSFDTDAGALAAAPSERFAKRDKILADFQKRLDATRGGPMDATQRDELGRTVATGDAAPAAAPEHELAEVPADPATEPQPDDVLPTDDPDAVEEEPAPDPDAPAEEDPAAAAAKAPETTAQDIALRVELETARGQLAAARQALADSQRAHQPEEFENFYASPIDWLKGKLSAVLGVKPDDPSVAAEAEALVGEWTWSSINVQDLPQQQQAQLRTDRTDRKIRLDTHRRQAERTAAQVSKEETEARKLILSVLDAGKDQFAAAPLATLRYGAPLEEVVHDRLLRGIREGAIKDWDKRPIPELIAEAARLVDSDSRTWAQQLGPQLAHLIPPASAPVAGASARPDAPQKPAPSQATPKPGPNAKPRTLPTQKAGAAPSRPGAPPKPEPLPLDPEQRKNEVIRRHEARLRR